MKNRRKFLLLTSILLSGFSSHLAGAFEIKINAGVLPSIWYSSTNIYSSDSVEIFGAIQNHSNQSFSGKADLYIDDVIDSETNFVSKADSLIELNFPWKALKGDYTFKIRILEVSNLDKNSTSTIATSSLISFESDKITLSVGEHMTFDNIKENVFKTAKTVINSIDSLANNLADKIEDLKKSTSTDENTPSTNTSNKSKNISNKISKELVEQASDANTNYENLAAVGGSIPSNKVGGIIYNKSLDFFSLIVRNWKITTIVGVATVAAVIFMI